MDAIVRLDTPTIGFFLQELISQHSAEPQPEEVQSKEK